MFMVNQGFCNKHMLDFIGVNLLYFVVNTPVYPLGKHFIGFFNIELPCNKEPDKLLAI